MIELHRQYFRLVPASEEPNARVQVYVTDNATKLYITEVRPEDVGTWQCLASSTAGSATSRSKVDLEGKIRTEHCV